MSMEEFEKSMIKTLCESPHDSWRNISGANSDDVVFLSYYGKAPVRIFKNGKTGPVEFKVNGETFECPVDCTLYEDLLNLYIVNQAQLKKEKREALLRYLKSESEKKNNNGENS